MTYSDWLIQAIARLAASESPRRDAEILLGFVTGKTRTFLIAFSETTLNPDEEQALATLLDRRAKGEPIAYLVGEREFWSLPLKVSPATLIPRPDTEILVESALEHLPDQPCTVLDLGTGSGAIALAIANERADCMVRGVDFQPQAVALAKENAKRLDIHNVEFLQGSWYAPVAYQRFAMIVSNPPYIDSQDPHLSKGDVRFEPSSALVAENGGLSDIMHIVQYAPDYLHPNGWLMIEHGWQQGESVRQLFRQRGFEQVISVNDYGGNERITLGHWLMS